MTAGIDLIRRSAVLLAADEDVDAAIARVLDELDRAVPGLDAKVVEVDAWPADEGSQGICQASPGPAAPGLRVLPITWAKTTFGFLVVHALDIEAELEVIATQMAFALAAARARQQLDAHDRQLAEALGTASHDLRTPLTGILWAAELMDADGDDPEARKESVEIILRQAGRLSEMVDELVGLPYQDAAEP